MNYEILFAGAGTALLGALVGSLVTARLTYGFQKELLRQQLEFEREQARCDTEQRTQMSLAVQDALAGIGTVIGEKVKQLVSIIEKR